MIVMRGEDFGVIQRDGHRNVFAYFMVASPESFVPAFRVVEESVTSLVMKHI